MIATVQKHISVMWVAIGVIVGLLGVGAVVLATSAEARPQPIATYPVREATQAEMREALAVDGVINAAQMDVIGTIVEGPDGRFMTWRLDDDVVDCLYVGRPDGALDFYSCTVLDWSHVVAQPVETFRLDDGVIKAAKALGATELLIVYEKEQLSVWPVGPDLPMP